jgi:hypothetical protein
MEEIGMKQKKPTLNEQIALLSAQYSVYPAELFQALIQAKKSTKTACEDLTVEYRGTIENEAIFLIKRNNNVVVQFRVPEDTLQKKDITFENWMNTDKIRREIAKQNPQPPQSKQIKDLRHGMKKINIKATVLETPKPQMVRTQYGNTVNMANVQIEDETGKIKLCLWDHQVDTVKAGDMVQINGASVATFKGERQLRIGKTGTITQQQQSEPPKIKAAT